MAAENWKVEVAEIGDGLWNVRGDKTNGDHQGTTVIGNEDEARKAAHAIFGRHAHVTVTLKPS